MMRATVNAVTADSATTIFSPEGRELAIVSRHALRTEAYDRALVVASMEIAHWILRDGAVFVLCVEPPHAAEVAREIETWEQNRSGEPQAPAPPAPLEKYPPFSLWIAGWVSAVFFLIQNNAPDWWTDVGACANRAVLRGEWWRVFTAQTLHADVGHIAANLAAGLLFAAFLLPIFGGGWTWFLVLLSGALGNWLNSWAYRNEMHISIGASVAVFGALGILVGAQCVSQILALRKLRTREILLPLGAGLAWFACFGANKETDFTAHFYGLLVGVPLGAAAVFLQLKKRTPRAGQIALGLATLGILLLAWCAAAAHAKTF